MKGPPFCLRIRFPSLTQDEPVTVHLGFSDLQVKLLSGVWGFSYHRSPQPRGSGEETVLEEEILDDVEEELDGLQRYLRG